MSGSRGKRMKKGNLVFLLVSLQSLSRSTNSLQPPFLQDAKHPRHKMKYDTRRFSFSPNNLPSPKMRERKPSLPTYVADLPIPVFSSYLLPSLFSVKWSGFLDFRA